MYKFIWMISLLVNFHVLENSYGKIMECDDRGEEYCERLMRECEDQQENVLKLKKTEKKVSQEIIDADDSTDGRVIKLQAIYKFTSFKIKELEKITDFCEDKIKPICSKC